MTTYRIRWTSLPRSPYNTIFSFVWHGVLPGYDKPTMESIRTKRKIDPQLLIAIGLMVISAGALSVSFRQAWLMGKQTEILLEQTRSGAWPYLDLQLYKGTSQQGIEKYKIIVENKGLGPAVIEGVKIYYDETPARDWSDFMKKAGVADSLASTMSFENISNSVISEKEEVVVFDISMNPPVMDWLFERADRIEIEICYKSIFGDHWVARRKGFKTDVEERVNTKVDEYRLQGVMFAQ